MGAIIAVFGAIGVVIFACRLLFDKAESRETYAGRARSKRNADIASEMEKAARALYGFLVQMNFGRSRG